MIKLAAWTAAAIYSIIVYSLAIYGFTKLVMP